LPWPKCKLFSLVVVNSVNKVSRRTELESWSGLRSTEKGEAHGAS
jgi:hypothetical protein